MNDKKMQGKGVSDCVDAGSKAEHPTNEGCTVLGEQTHPDSRPKAGSKPVSVPQSLREAIAYFSDDLGVATEFLAAVRWPDGPECPACGSKAHSYIKTRRIWKCKECRRQYSAKLGTIFEDSPIPLDKWMLALWLIVNCKNGVS